MYIVGKRIRLGAPLEPDAVELNNSFSRTNFQWLEKVYTCKNRHFNLNNPVRDVIWHKNQPENKSVHDCVSHINRWSFQRIGEDVKSTFGLLPPSNNPIQNLCHAKDNSPSCPPNVAIQQILLFKRKEHSECTLSMFWTYEQYDMKHVQFR